MNSKALVFAVAAACLTSGAAFAQTYDYRSDRNDGDQRSTRYERNDSGDHYDRNDNRQSGERRDYGHHDGYNRYQYQPRHDDRNDGRWSGYGHRDYAYGARYGNRDYAYGGQQQYRMQRGERLTQYNRGDTYVVSDWRSRRLYQPQRGYQWVQAGNDYALVAIATGIIASVLLNH